MAVKAYSRTQAKFGCVKFTIISHVNRCDLQLPVRRGAVKSVNHAMNLQEHFRQLFNHPTTLKDLGMKEERSKQIMSATIDVWKDSPQNPFALACLINALSKCPPSGTSGRSKCPSGTSGRCSRILGHDSRIDNGGRSRPESRLVAESRQGRVGTKNHM